MGAKIADSGKIKKSTARKPAETVVPARSGESMTVKLFNTAVKKASSKGVKIAKTVPKEANPYVLPPDEAVEVAKKVGIITRSGNLSPKFK